jgi:hypothetical protein
MYCCRGCVFLLHRITGVGKRGIICCVSVFVCVCVCVCVCFSTWVERGITRESLPGQVSGLTSRRANNARPESWTADRIAWRQFDIGHSQGKSTARPPLPSVWENMETCFSRMKK